MLSTVHIHTLTELQIQDILPLFLKKYTTKPMNIITKNM
jgi:hypothetical protein